MVTVTGGSTTYYYLCSDHLNSITGIMDASGKMLEEYSYDPWGRRRSPEDWLTTDVTAPVITTRGYTGHEHLDAFGLIHMNGRIYDPHLGRILNPDPIIQEPLNIQNYNRYSYCLNNPLKYTDPSGYMSFYKAMNYLLNETEHGGYWEKGGAAVPFRQEDVDFILNGLSVSNGGYGGGGGRSGGGSAYIEEITWGTNNGIALNLSDRSGTSWYFATDGDLEYFVVFNRTVTTPNGVIATNGGDGITGQDMLGLVMQTGNFVSSVSDDARAFANGKYVHGTGKVYSQKFYGNQHVSKYSVSASKANSLKYAKTMGRTSTGLTVVGGVVTVADGLFGEYGWQNHHTADLAVSAMIYGTAAAFPVAGWILGGLYFVGDMASQYYTGKSITENLFD